MAIPEGMITVQETARRLGRSIEQVRRYLREGKLRGQRIGQQWFVEEASLGLPYPSVVGRPQRVKEPTAVMETRKVMDEEISSIIKSIDANREAIRRRLGGNVDIDVVEMVRIDRQEH